MALFDLTTLNDMAIDAPARAISNCSSSQSTPIKSTVNWIPFPVRLERDHFRMKRSLH